MVREDKKGNEFSITVEGTGETNVSNSVRLNLHINATRAMIADTVILTKDESQKDLDISEKVIALYLNEIGQLIRHTSIHSDLLNRKSNFHLVKDFLYHIQNNEDIKAIIDLDNMELKRE